MCRARERYTKTTSASTSDEPPTIEEVASKWGIRAPFDFPEDVFLSIELTRNGLKNCRGTVEYPKEFDGL